MEEAPTWFSERFDDNTKSAVRNIRPKPIESDSAIQDAFDVAEPEFKIAFVEFNLDEVTTELESITDEEVSEVVGRITNAEAIKLAIAAIEDDKAKEITTRQQRESEAIEARRIELDAEAVRLRQSAQALAIERERLEQQPKSEPVKEWEPARRRRRR